jgi:hypothetical protein
MEYRAAEAGNQVAGVELAGCLVCDPVLAAPRGNGTWNHGPVNDHDPLQFAGCA